MPFLERADGPACPKCGCEAAAKVGMSGDSIVYECDHCGHRQLHSQTATDDTELPVVQFARTKCPHCGSQDNQIYATNKGPFNRRYHRCQTCQKRFLSVEK